MTIAIVNGQSIRETGANQLADITQGAPSLVRAQNAAPGVAASPINSGTVIGSEDVSREERSFGVADWSSRRAAWLNRQGS